MKFITLKLIVLGATAQDHYVKKSVDPCVLKFIELLLYTVDTAIVQW